MISRISPFALLLAATALGSGAALAQDGYVGLSFGSYTADLIDDGESYDGRYTSLDGLYAVSIGPGKLVIEGGHRDDNLPVGATDGDEMTTQSYLAAHYVYGFSNGATASAFLGRGWAPHDSAAEDYALIYGGIGGSYAIGSDWAVYGQVGAGDAPDAVTTDSAGFDNAYFARAGVTYTGLQGTALSLELETAHADTYEDAGEPGDFGAIALSGVTALPSNPAFQFTYGLRSSYYDAGPDDGDRTEEVSASLGFRYVFGGKAPGGFEREGVLGSPYLPLRASNWVPSVD